jgi:hypothetical protein
MVPSREGSASRPGSTPRAGFGSVVEAFAPASTVAGAVSVSLVAASASAVATRSGVVDELCAVAATEASNDTESQKMNPGGLARRRTCFMGPP